MSTAWFCSCPVGSGQEINCTESMFCKQAVLMESGCCKRHVPPGQAEIKLPRGPIITPLSTCMRLYPGGRCCQVTLRTRTKCYRSPGTPEALQLIPGGNRVTREGSGEGVGVGSAGTHWEAVSIKFGERWKTCPYFYLLIMWYSKLRLILFQVRIRLLRL